ncbi:MAG: VanZ family protein [Bacteroidaceae bacterium]|nr:VanZ family protein [Bacteroidaceae bacterium]
MMKRLLRTYPLAIIILIIITWLSLGTPPDTDLDGIKGIDKVAHFCMYFGLAAITWLEYLKNHDSLNWTKLALFAITAPILFSGMMEIAQMVLTDNRQGEWADFLANSLGVICSVPAGYCLLRPIIWKKK